MAFLFCAIKLASVVNSRKKRAKLNKNKIFLRKNKKPAGQTLEANEQQQKPNIFATN